MHKQPTGRVVNDLAGYLKLGTVHGRGLADGCPGLGDLRVAVYGQHTSHPRGYLAVLKASQDVRQQDHGISGDTGGGPVGLR